MAAASLSEGGKGLHYHSLGNEGYRYCESLNESSEGKEIVRNISSWPLDSELASLVDSLVLLVNCTGAKLLIYS